MPDYKLTWNGAGVKKDIEEGGTEGLQEAVEFLLDESNKTAPIADGTLINSGATSVDGLEASVSYDTPYAVRQHEDTTLRHPNGRQAKFLENAYKENITAIQEFLAKAIKGAIA
jgi:hypothetical protein